VDFQVLVCIPFHSAVQTCTRQ